MLGYWLGAAVLGGISALLYLSVVAMPGGVALASLTQTPLFLAGLALGFPAALTASAVAATAVTAAAGMIGGFAFALVNAVPVLVLVQRALLSRRASDGGVEWYPPGLLVTWLSGLAAMALALLLLLLASGEGGILGSVERQVDAILPLFGPNREAVRPLFESIAPIIPGMVIAAWMMVTMANGAAGQAIAVKAGRALRPAPQMAETELPNWLAVALAVAAGLALLGPGMIGTLGANATVVLTVPFLMLGLAVVHAATRGLRSRGLLLGGLYVVSAILTWPVIAIIALGLIEQGFGLKRRFVAPRPGGK